MTKGKKNSYSQNPPKKIKYFKNSLSFSKDKNHKKTMIKLKNPKITAINENSNFIYDVDEFEHYFSQTKDHNLLKLNHEELLFLKSKISETNYAQNHGPKNTYINIPLQTYEKINSFVPKIDKQNDEVLYIKNLVENQKQKGFLSCRRISNQYFIDTGKKISKTKVNNILRNKLNLRFLKSAIKTDKLLNNKNILISLCFIKIVIKCLKLNFKLIFIDETSIQCNNNNFKAWRKKDETIYYNIKNTKRKNLIAAVGEDSLVHYSIN